MPASGASASAATASTSTSPTAGMPGITGSMPRLDARKPQSSFDDDDAAPVESGEHAQWGLDDDGPAPDIKLAADLPADAPADDPDPLTYPLVDAPSANLGDDVASVVGVRFVVGGRVSWFDAGEGDYAAGERVIVDSDRGQRLAWVAVPPARRTTRDRGLRRVVRRANDHDLRGEREGDTDRAKALRIAKDKAAALRMPMKVFRVELSGPLGRGGKVNVYYTSDERLDMREFLRDVSSALSARIELRQLGVRDEAKAVGGIGSCGLTLCCTTWLPDFVPVSIKMAKDQGLVLSPTKVSGQCGRLKCCLVYEQAAYAELRKGLPKLGKRVYAPRGEGRVVEVDVLRQRIRVSYGAGDTEVLPATEVKPMFPSGHQPPQRGGGGGRPMPEPMAEEERDDDPSEQTDDPSALVNQSMQPSFVGGAPSPLDVDEEPPTAAAPDPEPDPAADGIDEALRDVPDDDQVDPS
jgi:cell fate regulator YaaT (PSP1 superfamily)